MDDDNRCLNFRTLELAEIPYIRGKYLQHNPSRLCDWTVGGIFMWRSYFRMEVAELDDTLIFKLQYLGKITAFSFQMNDHYSDVIQHLKRYAVQQGLPMILCLVEQPFLEEIQANENCLHVQPEEDWYDYLYEIDDLRSYEGKKYKTQRNHVHAFARDYPDAQFVKGDIDPQEAKEFLDAFYADKTMEGPIEEEEKIRTYELFEHQDLYQFRTLALRIGGKLVGLASGEVIGDTVYEHIEKALDSVNGVYPALAQAYAASIEDPEVRYVNREEDCGDEGLRYSKEKYRPVTKLAKYTVEICTKQ